MTTLHLFVARGRETRPRSIARREIDDKPHGEAARRAALEWAQENVTGLKVTRWWVVAADTEAEGRALLDALLANYTPSMPPIPDSIKRRIVALGRG